VLLTNLLVRFFDCRYFKHIVLIIIKKGEIFWQKQIQPWARYRAQNSQVLLATSLRRVPLAWVRDLVAQPFSRSPRREPRIRTQCETLQLSLRRGGPAWARLAGSRVCSRTQIAQLCPNCTTNNTKTQLIHYQAQIVATIIRTGRISSIHITQLEIKSYLPIPYQNPPSNHKKMHSKACTQSQPIKFWITAHTTQVPWHTIYPMHTPKITTRKLG